jgi:hypothetical protein
MHILQQKYSLFVASQNLSSHILRRIKELFVARLMLFMLPGKWLIAPLLIFLPYFGVFSPDLLGLSQKNHR